MDRADRRTDMIDVDRPELPSGGDDREAQHAFRGVGNDGADDFLPSQHRVFFGAGMIEGRLRAEFTILGTFSAARVDDRADIESIAAENLVQPCKWNFRFRCFLKVADRKSVV